MFIGLLNMRKWGHAGMGIKIGNIANITTLAQIYSSSIHQKSMHWPISNKEGAVRVRSHRLDVLSVSKNAQNVFLLAGMRITFSTSINPDYLVEGQ